MDLDIFDLLSFWRLAATSTSPRSSFTISQLHHLAASHPPSPLSAVIATYFPRLQRARRPARRPFWKKQPLVHKLTVKKAAQTVIMAAYVRQPWDSDTSSSSSDESESSTDSGATTILQPPFDTVHTQPTENVLGLICLLDAAISDMSICISRCPQVAKTKQRL